LLPSDLAGERGRQQGGGGGDGGPGEGEKKRRGAGTGKTVEGPGCPGGLAQTILFSRKFVLEFCRAQGGPERGAKRGHGGTTFPLRKNPGDQGGKVGAGRLGRGGRSCGMLSPRCPIFQNPRPKKRKFSGPNGRVGKKKRNSEKRGGGNDPGEVKTFSPRPEVCFFRGGDVQHFSYPGRGCCQLFFPRGGTASFSFRKGRRGALFWRKNGLG